MQMSLYPLIVIVYLHQVRVYHQVLVTLRRLSGLFNHCFSIFTEGPDQIYEKRNATEIMILIKAD